MVDTGGKSFTKTTRKRALSFLVDDSHRGGSDGTNHLSPPPM
jgi:hypothetical protein